MAAKRGIITAVVFICLMLAVWGAFRILQTKESSDITVTATVLSMNEAGQATRRKIQPKETAEIRIGNSDRSRSEAFTNGVLHTGFDHGAIEIRGVISAEEIRKNCPQSVVSEDWPFSIMFYNTSSGRVFHIYLDIDYNTLEGTAKADLYFFEDHYAMATVAHWEGKPGEPIIIYPDGMDI